MARSRNIKPSFFDNDNLALQNDPLGRLLFIGLWTLADCNGNLEWRSHRIKVKLLPYDDCDVDRLAINLDKSGFVRFYSDGDKILLNIPNFTVHQNPHKNEREKGAAVIEYSDELRQLIDITTLAINPDKSGLKLEYSHSDRADSLLLIPESPILNPESGEGSDEPSLALEYLNEKCGANFKATKTNLGPINARMSEGATLDDVKAVIDFKHQEWADDPKMAQYLRPDTLFRPTKFPGYLAAARAKAVPKDPGHNQPGYDPDLSRATDMSGFD